MARPRLEATTLVLALLWAVGARAETVSLTGPLGHVFDVDVRGAASPETGSDSGTGCIMTGGFDDATDRWPFLCVCDGCLLPAPCAPSDIYNSGDVPFARDLPGRRRATLASETLHGLTVHREVFVPATGAIDFARYYDVFENTTGTDVTVNVRLGTAVAGSQNNDLGSDWDTVVWTTADGDAVLDPDDTWYVTDDRAFDSGDPSLGHVVQGIDRTVTVHSAAIDSLGADDPSDFSWEFQGVTVPAGERVVMVSFFIQASGVLEAAAAASAFEDILWWPPEAMEGIAPTDLAAIVNFVGDADGDGYTGSDGDCDDRDPRVHPGADEVCDGADNDCDGDVDEGLLGVWYGDADGDGFGDPETGAEACEAGEGQVDNGDDCDDATAAVNPAAAEVRDGVDNDCNGEVDDVATDGDGDADADAGGDGDADADGDGDGEADADGAGDGDTDADSEPDLPPPPSDGCDCAVASSATSPGRALALLLSLACAR